MQNKHWQTIIQYPWLIISNCFISEKNAEKESTSEEKSNDNTDENEQDMYMLTLSQNVSQQSEPNSMEEKDKHQTLFEECSQVMSYWII